MIRKTLQKTKQATFSILLPNANAKGMHPTGTGFFVSPDGWFVTAAHVVHEEGDLNKPVRTDIVKAWLMQAAKDTSLPMLQHVSLQHEDPITDFALLKVDFEANSNKESVKGKKGFSFIEVSSRELEEGEPIYAFGYPLSMGSFWDIGGPIIGEFNLSPRATSAIVSSTYEQTKMVEISDDPKIYVLDKALNYGNSGGPIMATETGKVHALCSRFQPVPVQQKHIMKDGKPLVIFIPSLYGVGSSLGTPTILKALKEYGVSISNT